MNESEWTNNQWVFFLFFADLILNESDSSIQETERDLTTKREDKLSDLIGGCTILIDENGNTPKSSLTTMTTTSPSDLTISDTAENAISKGESSGSEKTAKLVSSHDAKDSSGTSLKQQIIATISNQGIGSEEQNNLLVTENNKGVSESVLKCKYTYVDNPHPWVLATY